MKKATRCTTPATLVMAFALSGLFVVGCTSMGNQTRAIPRIAKPTEPILEVGFDPDDNALSVAVEKLLDARGVKVKLVSTPQVRQQRGDKEYTYDEVQTRYLLRVRSEDLDRCIPEGSRQMHFNISVIDFQERTRVFLQNGEFGCQDTILKYFRDWLSGVTRPPK